MTRPTTIPALDPANEPAPVRARLRDGAAVSLRPLANGETGPLLSVFDGMSAESRALRYLTGLPRIPQVMLSTLTDVDGDRHVAWLATIDGEAAGIARYVRAPRCWTTAEIALEVVDRHHGRGLGSVLVDTVTTVAAARGVRRVRATMAPWNDVAPRLLRRIGASDHLREGLREAEGPLRLVEPPLVDRAAVLRLACGPRWDEALDIG